MSSKAVTMKTKSKRTLTPRLRFPEFQNKGEWEATELEDVCTPRQWPTISSYELTENGFPVFGANGFVGFYSDYNHEHATIAVTCRGSTCGEVSLIPPKSYITGNSMSLDDIKVNLINQSFLFQYLRGRGFAAEISGSAQPQIVGTAIKRKKIVRPTIPEQQKIAVCLCSLDGLIAAEGRKLAALRNHKRGLMQQLFPQPGQTQPRLRFPEFRDKGEWEEKKLADVAKSVKTGKLDANAMVENGQYRFYTCAKTYYQIDNYAFEGEALLIAGNGAHLGYIHHYIGKFNAYQRTYVLQNFETNVVFLRCLLERYLPSRILLEKKDGNTPYIVLSTITKMPLLVPQEDEEQRRIADCLTSLDDRINAQAAKIDALKQHKRGLMQQLFPAPEEP